MRIVRLGWSQWVKADEPEVFEEHIQVTLKVSLRSVLNNTVAILVRSDGYINDVV